MVQIEKLKIAIKLLEQALKYESRIKEDPAFYMAGISKSYEVCLEYAWKYLRALVADKGFEVFGPKDSIKIAAQIGLLKEPEEWLRFINERNLAVHDYATISNEQYLQSAKDFLKEVKKLKVS